jgi:hypothetical protein
MQNSPSKFSPLLLSREPKKIAEFCIQNVNKNTGLALILYAKFQQRPGKLLFLARIIARFESRLNPFLLGSLATVK